MCSVGDRQWGIGSLIANVLVLALRVACIQFIDVGYGYSDLYLAWSVSVCLSVCLSVCHDCEPC